MLIRQLEYLVALAHEKHFARAAERCEISQPALSLAVKQLESELEIEIVQRGNRFHAFTREGEIVLRWAQRILLDKETLRQELRLCASSLSGALRLGVIPSATATSSFLTSAFLGAHSEVSIAEMEMTSADIVRAIAAFELDAGVTYLDSDIPDHVRTLPIGREEYVLVTPADSPLASRTFVTWREAATLPLCLLNGEMQNRRILDVAFESAGTRPNVVVETNSMMSIYCYLRLGSWSSVVARTFVEWLAPPPGSRVIRLVEPTVVKTVGLIVARRSPVPPLLHAFWQHVERFAVGADLSLA